MTSRKPITEGSGFFGFRARFVPRLGGREGSEKVRDDIDREQASLWEALQFGKMLTYPTASAELRYIAHETTREIVVWLLFDCRELKAAHKHEFFRDVTRLLPRGFGWEAHRDIDAGDLPEPTRARSGHWWTSRAVRRLVFADVPAAPEVEEPDKRTGGDEAESFSGSIALIPSARAVRRKVMGFDQRATSAAQLDEGTWAIPLITAVRSGNHATPAFFEQLQSVAPAALSIRFARLPGNQLPVLRSVANHYLQQNLGGLSSGIESAYGAPSASYQRYLLPDDLFDVLDISFATASQDTNEALTHFFCSQIGGLTGFHQADIAKRKDLKNFANEAMVSEFFNSTRDKRQQYLLDDLDAFSAEAPEEDYAVERFMLDAPYVYTFHEILSLVQLPIADERGLPGLDSRPPAPFNYPSLSYDPVFDTESNIPFTGGEISGARADGLRLGIRGRVHLPGDGRVESDAGGGAAAVHWHRLRKSDLTKHALIVGMTGSGKTTVTTFLLRELARTGVPFCIIEPVKSEYFDKLSPHADIQRMSFEGSYDEKRSDTFFVFDPFRIPLGVTVSAHVSYMRAVLQAAFPMDILGSMLLEDGLLRYYTDKETCGFSRFARGSASLFIAPAAPDGRRTIFPSFRTFRHYFLTNYLTRHAFASVRETGKEAEARDHAVSFFRRRFDLLAGGLLGESTEEAERRALRAIAEGRPNPLEDDACRLLEGNTIFELDAMPDDDDKALIMAFVLTYIFERRQAESFAERVQLRSSGKVRQNSTGLLRHVLVIEEAHRLLSAASAHSNRGEFGGVDPKSKAIALFVNMLAEIRSQGQGIILVEQIPTKLVSEVMKNTNLKVMLRLPSYEDRLILGQTMNLSEEQIQYVATLRASHVSGVDFVAFDEQLDQPILLNLPLPRSDSGADRPWLFNEFFSKQEAKTWERSA